jgi:hypothetical protein
VLFPENRFLRQRPGYCLSTFPTTTGADVYVCVVRVCCTGMSTCAMHMPCPILDVRCVFEAFIHVERLTVGEKTVFAPMVCMCVKPLMVIHSMNG